MSDTYWSEEAFLRPNFVSDGVWQQILNNFLGTISDPVTDLPNALQDDIARLQSMGLSNPSDLTALELPR